MLEIKTLNSRHTDLIEEYLLKIDETIFNATEGHTHDKFLAFKEIQTRGIGFSNSLAIQFLREDRADDWVVMLPNFLVFSVIGFVSALKDEKNSDELSQIIDDLYEYHLEAINKMEDLIIDYNNSNYVKTKSK